MLRIIMNCDDFFIRFGLHILPNNIIIENLSNKTT